MLFKILNTDLSIRYIIDSNCIVIAVIGGANLAYDVGHKYIEKYIDTKNKYPLTYPELVCLRLEGKINSEIYSKISEYYDQSM